MKAVALQYLGYYDTPQLWEGELVGLHQINLVNSLSTGCIYDSEITKQLRIGQRIEQFVFYELMQIEGMKVLVENLQISQEKITIGELDALINFNSENIHLEISYKFYLFDGSVGNDNLANWIGPNRNDSLLEKMNKLKVKQFPLLFTEETKATLKSIGLPQENYKQQVYFKAQLFVPFSMRGNSFELINNACIVGYYIKSNEITIFKDHLFYLPPKVDWCVTPHNDVNWCSYNEIKEELMTLLKSKRSPMSWIKSSEGNLEKVFFVWW